MINIRRAEIKDIPTIMQFLEDHWLHGYALAHDRELFDWQFVYNGKVNIWIGIDDEVGKLYALQSMIFYADIYNPDVSGSTWLAIKSPNPLLAFDVQDFAWNEVGPVTSLSPGLRPDAVKAFKTMGKSIVEFDHYYRLADKNKYHIAVISNKSIPVIPDTGYRIELINNISEMQAIIPESQLMGGTPRKSYQYISWRYFKHPIFKYDIWKVLNPYGDACAILITREEHANGETACKIIDFYGEANILGFITAALDNLILSRRYEYIDVYSYGVNKLIYEKGGLLRCDESSVNIIPNFFQPYTPINSSIYMIDPERDDVRLFRGDGDQDKPRLYKTN